MRTRVSGRSVEEHDDVTDQMMTLETPIGRILVPLVPIWDGGCQSNHSETKFDSYSYLVYVSKTPRHVEDYGGGPARSIDI